MAKGPFKMKAGKEGPMKKNFGIGSPVKGKIPTDIEETTKTNYKSSKSNSKQMEIQKETPEQRERRLELAYKKEFISPEYQEQLALDKYHAKRDKKNKGRVE